MFERMKAGWRLARQVRESVSRSKSLFYYPLISGIVAIAVFAFTFVSLFISFPLNFTVGGSVEIYILSLLVAYIVVGFVSTLILLAMLIAYRANNSGSPVSLREAFGRAWAYRLQALEWALFYTMLVVILRIIESRLRGIAQLVIGAVGSMMIAIATFFAIPSILDNKSGPIKAVKESVSTITRNFGTTFGGVAYVDLYTLIFTLGGFALLLLGIFLISVALPVFILVALIIAGIALMAFGVVLNYTYMNVLKLVLFDYINGKGLPEGFNEDDIKSAIKRKKSRTMFNLSSGQSEF
ncbi:MAG: DUF6159 family protein [Thermoplasmatales archaeon]|nr:DUF6159 family protein [Thermoplasmatales archaeon]